MRPEERLYLHSDIELGIKASDYGTETDSVIGRHKNRYRSALRVIESNILRTDLHILDIACGSGYGSQILDFSLDSEYHGVDSSFDAITYAYRHYAKKDKISFTCADVLDPDIGNGYDTIVSIETLEHLPKERHESFVHQMWLKLRDDGLFYLTTPISEDGEQSGNPHHLYEPKMSEILDRLRPLFKNVGVAVRTTRTTAGVQRMGAFTCVK
tara:strand:- start:93 stop:728 length:636 start_codon:yes stop_codon:yes gene_type:complete